MKKIFIFIILFSKLINATEKLYEINYGSQGKLQLSRSNLYIGIKSYSDLDKKIREEFESPRIIRKEGIKDIGEFRILKPILNNIESLRNRIGNDKITHVYYVKPHDTNFFVPTGDIYIKFKKDISHNNCLRVLKKEHLFPTEVRSNNEFIAVLTSSSLDSLDVTEKLQSSKKIEIAEPDLAVGIKVRDNNKLEQKIDSKVDYFIDILAHLKYVKKVEERYGINLAVYAARNLAESFSIDDIDDIDDYIERLRDIHPTKFDKIILEIKGKIEKISPRYQHKIKTNITPKNFYMPYRTFNSGVYMGK